jgi:hypothetical protein
LRGEKVPGGECSGGRANHGSRGGENARGEKVSGGRKCVSRCFMHCGYDTYVLITDPVRFICLKQYFLQGLNNCKHRTFVINLTGSPWQSKEQLSTTASKILECVVCICESFGYVGVQK